ncbi:MAG: TetR/AcrR family transcriptional regulator [Gemmatimonadota bacterium]
MNDSRDTRSSLIEAGRTLFAEGGYEGTSVRAITGRAGANLGAVTYHFGSKEALYHAVLEAVLAPLRSKLERASDSGGSPLDRIEAFVRAFFAYLLAHPELRQLMLQQIGTGPGSPAARRTLRFNLGLLRALIEEGQDGGSIRPGRPEFLAFSVGAQPVALNLVRPVIEQAVDFDPLGPETGHLLIDHVVRFVRAGLAADGGEDGA